MKKNGFCGLLVILMIISFIGCGEEENVPEIYTITIGTLTNANGSTITASPTSGVEGTEITLTIIEENTYRLKAGTLKYGTTSINETELKFNLPANNVYITAEFQSLLIGNWETSNGTVSYEFTFYENEYILIIKNNSVLANAVKGFWVPQSNNLVKMNDTHQGIISNVIDINNLPELSSVRIYNCEILTDMSFKIFPGSVNEQTYTFIE